jgi:hypothetical protein
MKELPLFGGHVAIVDDDVYEWAKDFRWYRSTYGYAVCNVGYGREGRTVWMLHRAIVGEPPAGQVIDHINCDRLDNRRENLVFVTRTLNNLNSKLRKGYHPHQGRWRVRFKVNAMHIDISGIETEAEAQSIAALIRGSLIYHERMKGGYSNR